MLARVFNLETGTHYPYGMKLSSTSKKKNNKIVSFVKAHFKYIAKNNFWFFFKLEEVPILLYTLRHLPHRWVYRPQIVAFGSGLSNRTPMKLRINFSVYCPSPDSRPWDSNFARNFIEFQIPLLNMVIELMVQ